MLKEIVVNTAVKPGIDAQLRSVCTPLFASLRRDTLDNQHLRLLLSFALAEDANCVDIGANKGEILEFCSSFLNLEDFTYAIKIL